MRGSGLHAPTKHVSLWHRGAALRGGWRGLSTRCQAGGGRRRGRSATCRQRPPCSAAWAWTAARRCRPRRRRSAGCTPRAPPPPASAPRCRCERLAAGRSTHAGRPLADPPRAKAGLSGASNTLNTSLRFPAGGAFHRLRQQMCMVRHMQTAIRARLHRKLLPQTNANRADCHLGMSPSQAVALITCE